MKNFKPALLLLLVFLAGIAVGVIGTRIVVRRVMMRIRDNPNWVVQRIERDLAGQLKLTTEQQADVHVILIESQKQLQQLRSEFQPKMIDIFQRGEQRIADKLTPDQREKFQKYLKEKRSMLPASIEHVGRQKTEH